MAIEYKDYYKALGVARDASEEEVRSAFRRLARIFHPDKTGNDTEAETQFKEINEAYEVLGDAAKRQRYDEFVGAWEANGWGPDSFQEFLRGEPNFSRGPEHYRFDGAGFSEFFQQMFGRRPNGQSRPTERPERPKGSKQGSEQHGRAANAEDLRGDDLESDIWVTLDEVANGAVRPIAMNRAVKCPACLGMGQVNVHRCEECNGSGSILKTESYKVKIPKGIKEGAFLRVSGRGEPGVTTPGDLYLRVRFQLHPDFRMEHGVLVHELQVAPWEAVLGATVSVPTLDGKATVKVPPGTQNGKKLRLKGRGIPDADSGAGDLILVVKVQVPNNAGARERELWEQLARESTFHPRAN